MAFYNSERSLEAAISSVLSQTLKRIELIAVDDGSTDGSREIVERIARTDSRVRYIWQAQSGGPSSPRNNGIKHASGEFIAFLDGDDLYAADRLERCHALLSANPEFGWMYHDFCRFSTHPESDAETQFLRQEGYLSRAREALVAAPDLGANVYASTDLLSLFYCSSGIGVLVNTVFIRRTVLEQLGEQPFPTGIRVGEDSSLWLELSGISRALFLDAILAFYRRSPGSILASTERMEATRARAQVKRAYLRRIESRVSSGTIAVGSDIQDRIASAWMSIGNRCRGDDLIPEARSDLMRSFIKAHAFSIRVRALFLLAKTYLT